MRKAKFLEQEKEFVDGELLYMGSGLKPGEEVPDGK